MGQSRMDHSSTKETTTRAEGLARGGLDRRKLLYLPIDGVVELGLEHERPRLRCVELSLREMRVWAPATWPTTIDLELRGLEVEDGSFELGGFARLRERRESGGADDLVLATLEYVDFDAVATANMQAAFAHLARCSRREEHLVMRFNWAFRDVAQLVAVCKTLLCLVELFGAWTDAGPSESARLYLAAKGQGLPPAHRSMLEIVWKLWCGSLDLPASPASALPESARSALLALRKAASRGPSGIDEWLRVEQR